MPKKAITNAKKSTKKVTSKAVTAARTKAKVAPKQQLHGFMNFIREQGVVGLAVGLVLGVQVKAVVDSLIASFINPLLGILLPGTGDLNKKVFTISLGDKQAIFTYGAFLSVLLSFIVVAAVIYYVVKALKLDKLDKQKS